MSTGTTSHVQSTAQVWDQLATPTTKPYRVLLAEDDAEMRALITWGLEAEGYEVTEARDGLDLLLRLEPSAGKGTKALWGHDFDLVVSDLRMPAFTGLEVLTSFRACDKKTPFILITAFGEHLTHQEAMDLGATAILDKPFELSDLVALLRRLRPRKEP